MASPVNSVASSIQTFVPAIRSIPGVRDFTVAESIVFDGWKRAVQAAFESFGFVHMESRPLELNQNLGFKGGLNKEIYSLCRLEDGKPVHMGLPFDRTVSLALFVAQYANKVIFPYKRHDVSCSFRGERAQMSTGRFRAFHQADVDIVDKNMGNSVLADAECFAAVYAALKRLSIPPFRMHVNHIKIAHAKLESFGFFEKSERQKALGIIDKLDKHSKDEIVALFKELFPSRNPEEFLEVVDAFSYTGSIRGISQEEEGWEEMREFFSHMASLGVPEEVLVYDARMVRGLDYYTGIVAETFFVPNVEKPFLSHCGSIASGGRYDHLVDAFLQKETGISGVGASIGLTRLFDILMVNGELELTRQSVADVAVCYRSQNELASAVSLANTLRERGYKVDLFTSQAKFKKQLKYANDKEIRYAFLVMSEESFVVRDMESKNQEDIPSLQDALEYFDHLYQQNREL